MDSVLPLVIYLVILTGVVIYIISRLNSMSTEGVSAPAPSSDPQSAHPELLFFYSDSCPHARAMMPEWDRASESLRSRVRMIKVPPESPAFQEFSDFHKGATPTVLYLTPEGAPIVYQGDRTAESLIAFAESRGVNSQGILQVDARN